MTLAQEDPSQFQNTYKKAYSHGLEEIYALETVDISSVRRIEVAEISSEHAPATKKVAASLQQHELPLGAEFASGLNSFVLEEPIEALPIGINVVKTLKNEDFLRIADLIDIEPMQLVRRGLGQGHIDELKKALETYLQDRTLYHTDHVDFEAWMRCMLPMQEKKKTLSILQEYHLEYVVSLTLHEKAETRRATKEMQKRWEQEVKEFCRSPQQMNLFRRRRTQVADVFIKPWMRQREGLAKEYELINRLERTALQNHDVRHFIACMQSLIGETHFFLKHHLIEVEEATYAVDPTVAKHYQQIIAMTDTYFYKPYVTYFFDELTTLILKECASRWIALTESFVRHVLRASKRYHVQKDQSGVLVVRRTQASH